MLEYYVRYVFLIIKLIYNNKKIEPKYEMKKLMTADTNKILTKTSSNYPRILSKIDSFSAFDNSLYPNFFILISTVSYVRPFSIFVPSFLHTSSMVKVCYLGNHSVVISSSISLIVLFKF